MLSTFDFMFACFPWWLDNHAGAIQAMCAFLGLGGLIWYCILTLQIREASLRQASAAVRPFIVIDELRDTDHQNFASTLKPISKEKIFIIRNLGNGPAMDIRWTSGSKSGTSINPKWIDLGDLAVGDWSHIFNDEAVPQMLFERPKEGMIFRFFDSADVRHETIEEMKDGVYTQRCRLQNPKKRF